MNTAADDTVFQIRLGAFLQGLALLGWSIGRNVRIEIRWSAGKADDARRYAAELVALAPDVILAHGVSSVRPLLQATRSVPIVFPIAGDPVGAGDHAHRPRRIGLRPSDPRHRQPGCARGEMQKLSAGKFHFQSPHGEQSEADGSPSMLLLSLRTRKGTVGIAGLLDRPRSSSRSRKAALRT
jgi:ABC transporter substrate binding protein